jgi:poly(A) polymerase
MTSPLELLCAGGFSAYLRSFSAIDRWLGRDSGSGALVLTNADTADLARLFDKIRYPGVNLADAALDWEKGCLYFQCVDSEKAVVSGRTEKVRRFSGDLSYSFLNFYMDCNTCHYIDPGGIYPELSAIRTAINNKEKNRGIVGTDIFELLKKSINPMHGSVLTDTALILARYFPETTEKQIKELATMLRAPKGIHGMEEQRFLLTGLLTAHNPGPGFDFLKITGYISNNWPELAILDNVDHSKEYHPEGNVWKHTMETFNYRKAGARHAFDLTVSLGLLLHDTGKAVAEPTAGRRFDGHAELGEVQARHFLERLEFDGQLISDVCYLVKNHLLPAALPRLPFSRTSEITSSPLFPALMELYRCDESSSFKGLDGYYDSAAVYQAYLKNVRNPYSPEGKKLNYKGFSKTSVLEMVKHKKEF